jgi:hypothetical protein
MHGGPATTDGLESVRQFGRTHADLALSLSIKARFAGEAEIEIHDALRRSDVEWMDGLRSALSVEQALFG